MQITDEGERTPSPIPGVIPEPVTVHHDRLAPPHHPARGAAPPAPTRRRHNAVRALADKLLSTLRGDKYMTDAYPPEWRQPGDRTPPAKPVGSDEHGVQTTGTEER